MQNPYFHHICTLYAAQTRAITPSSLWYQLCCHYYSKEKIHGLHRLFSLNNLYYLPLVEKFVALAKTDGTKSTSDEPERQLNITTIINTAFTHKRVHHGSKFIAMLKAFLTMHPGYLFSLTESIRRELAIKPYQMDIDDSKIRDFLISQTNNCSLLGESINGKAIFSRHFFSFLTLQDRIQIIENYNNKNKDIIKCGNLESNLFNKYNYQQLGNFVKIFSELPKAYQLNYINEYIEKIKASEKYYVSRNDNSMIRLGYVKYELVLLCVLLNKVDVTGNIKIIKFLNARMACASNYEDSDILHLVNLYPRRFNYLATLETLSIMFNRTELYRWEGRDHDINTKITRIINHSKAMGLLARSLNKNDRHKLVVIMLRNDSTREYATSAAFGAMADKVPKGLRHHVIMRLCDYLYSKSSQLCEQTCVTLSAMAEYITIHNMHNVLNGLHGNIHYQCENPEIQQKIRMAATNTINRIPKVMAKSAKLPFIITQIIRETRPVGLLNENKFLRAGREYVWIDDTEREHFFNEIFNLCHCEIQEIIQFVMISCYRLRKCIQPQQQVILINKICTYINLNEFNVDTINSENFPFKLLKLIEHCSSVIKYEQQRIFLIELLFHPRLQDIYHKQYAKYIQHLTPILAKSPFEFQKIIALKVLDKRDNFADLIPMFQSILNQASTEQRCELINAMMTRQTDLLKDITSWNNFTTATDLFNAILPYDSSNIISNNLCTIFIEKSQQHDTKYCDFSLEDINKRQPLRVAINMALYHLAGCIANHDKRRMIQHLFKSRNFVTADNELSVAISLSQFNDELSSTEKNLCIDNIKHYGIICRNLKLELEASIPSKILYTALSKLHAIDSDGKKNQVLDCVLAKNTLYPSKSPSIWSLALVDSNPNKLFDTKVSFLDELINGLQNAGKSLSQVLFCALELFDTLDEYEKNYYLYGHLSKVTISQPNSEAVISMQMVLIKCLEARAVRFEMLPLLPEAVVDLVMRYSR
jgi:hypothetical protein